MPAFSVSFGLGLVPQVLVDAERDDPEAEPDDAEGDEGVGVDHGDGLARGSSPVKRKIRIGDPEDGGQASVRQLGVRRERAHRSKS